MNSVSQARPRGGGFTLIELLIVVAIIAILAAIAVPNFLEAQVRSKVSRTKADMRSVATALEAYAVDASKYPPDYSHINLTTRVRTFLGRLSVLTTPVAYMTSLPPDIFADTVAAGGVVGTSPAPYREGGVATGAILRPVVYDYATFNPPGSLPTGGIADSYTVWNEIVSNPTSSSWALNSPGPDVTSHIYLGFSGLTIYDPTNGTVSQGQIIRTNAGADDKPKNL